MGLLFWIFRAIRAFAVILISILIAVALPTEGVRGDEPTIGGRVSTAERIRRVEAQMGVAEAVIGELVSKVAHLQSSVDRLEAQTSAEHLALAQQLKSEVLRLQSELTLAQQEQQVLRREIHNSQREVSANNAQSSTIRKSSSASRGEAAKKSAKEGSFTGRYRAPSGDILEIEQDGNVLYVNQTNGEGQSSWVYRQEIGRPFFVIEGRPPSMVDSGVRYGATNIVLMPIEGDSLKFIAMLKDYRRGRDQMRLRDFHVPLQRLD